VGFWRSQNSVADEGLEEGARGIFSLTRASEAAGATVGTQNH
jgi:hypothetical protein